MALPMTLVCFRFISISPSSVILIHDHDKNASCPTPSTRSHSHPPTNHATSKQTIVNKNQIHITMLRYVNDKSVMRQCTLCSSSKTSSQNNNISRCVCEPWESRKTPRKTIRNKFWCRWSWQQQHPNNDAFFFVSMNTHLIVWKFIYTHVVIDIGIEYAVKCMLTLTHFVTM